jgi:beta-glucosidase
MDEFLDQWTDIELVAFAMGAGRVGRQFTVKTENGDGPQGYDRFGVPTYSVSDGPNKVGGSGTTTAWACGTSRAQTWNEDLLYRVGLASGYESIAASTEINLAPGMNIHRNPLCGLTTSTMQRIPSSPAQWRPHGSAVSSSPATA